MTRADDVVAKLSLRAPYEIRMGKWVQPLTDAEAYLLWSLMARREVPLHDFATVVWGPEFRWPVEWQCGVRTRIQNLRGKLRPFGWRIASTGPGRSRGCVWWLERWEGEGVLAA